jgi:hypothetical protein
MQSITITVHIMDCDGLHATMQSLSVYEMVAEADA